LKNNKLKFKTNTWAKQRLFIERLDIADYSWQVEPMAFFGVDSVFRVNFVDNRG